MSYRGKHRGSRSVAGVLTVAVALVAVGTAGGYILLARRSNAHGRPAASSTSPTPGVGASRSPPVSPSGSPRPVSVTIAAVGDTMIGYQGHLPPSPSTYLSPVERLLQAQIVFGNLEGTLTNATASKCGPKSTDCVAFREPPSYAAYLKGAGFTVLNSANNHIYDFGAQGAADTSASLKAAGIAQDGLPGEIAYLHAGGVKVAVLGFAPYPFTSSLLDFTAAEQLIHTARRNADLVVVYMHAGAEGASALHVTGATETFAGENRGNPEAFAHMAVNSGADLVLASGPHVVRGMQFYRGHLIVYSLGDFAGYENFATSGVLGESCVLHVRMGADGSFRSARILSIRLSSAGQPFPDPSGAAARLIAQLSRQDFGSTAARIASNGTVTPP